MAQILPPLPENLIEERGDGINLFSLGYGAGVANYICFESLKGNCAKSEGDEILAKYKLWFKNQSSYHFDVFAEGYGEFQSNFQRSLLQFFFLTSDHNH